MKYESNPDYEKMYMTLFNTITDVIEQLKNAQMEAEELYINSDGGERPD